MSPTAQFILIMVATVALSLYAHYRHWKKTRRSERVFWTYPPSRNHRGRIYRPEVWEKAVRKYNAKAKRLDADLIIRPDRPVQLFTEPWNPDWIWKPAWKEGDKIRNVEFTKNALEGRCEHCQYEFDTSVCHTCQWHSGTPMGDVSKWCPKDKHYGDETTITVRRRLDHGVWVTRVVDCPAEGISVGDLRSSLGLPDHHWTATVNDQEADDTVVVHPEGTIKFMGKPL